MRLTAEEQDMLAGHMGEPVQRAIELQIAVGDFYDLYPPSRQRPVGFSGRNRAESFAARSCRCGGGPRLVRTARVNQRQAPHPSAEWCVKYASRFDHGGSMSALTEKQIVEILVGIAKTQAAIIHGLAAQDDYAAISRIQSGVGAFAGAGHQPQPPTTFENLGAHLLLKALSTPGAQGETLEQLAGREVHKLLSKSNTLQ